ncbi:MAG: hypothetical protein WC211_03680 [Dehalococcoidia bacterium]
MLDALAYVAPIITAITGFVSVVLTYKVITRVNHVIKLTNSNFSALQATLDQSLETNRVQAATAAALEEGRAIAAKEESNDRVQ